MHSYNINAKCCINQDDKCMATLAWANLLEKLSLTIRCTPAVVDVKDFPTTDQFQLIDRIHKLRDRLLSLSD